MARREELSASKLYKVVRSSMESIKEKRGKQAEIKLVDALMSGFALFSLKDPSLLRFDERRAKPENLQRVYGIEQVPSDTQMRTILDEVEPEELRKVYKGVFEAIEQGQVLEEYRYLGGYYLLSLDGSGYFASSKVHCENCLEKQLRNGETLYHHQMLGAVIVHPDQAAVIPLMPEAILKQDGTQKNDCERNAAKRFLGKFREDHPTLPVVVLEDSLSSNAPHIEELKKHHCGFILGVKEGDHAYLFAQVRQARKEGRSVEYELQEKGVTHRFHYVNQLPVNASNPEQLINFLEYWEISPKGTLYFSWVTHFTIHRINVYAIMRAGRARWKVENETFNTLKNQDYHFEHNFGHGKKHLSVVFALLMMLAFLVDQAQQAGSALFQSLLRKIPSKRSLWEKVRFLFYTLPFDSMETLYKALLFGFRIEKLVILEDTS